VNKGTPGRCCLVPDPINFVGAQDMVGLRFKKHLNPYYMLAILRSKEILKTIENNHVGLVIAHFRKQELVKLKLPIVSTNLRNRIGDFYRATSVKIEINNKINTELEQMAKTLYEYWFVQFDFPDANGKPYKSSGGKMVYNKVLKRHIPKSWEVGTLESVGDIIGGSTPSKAIDENFCFGTGTPWITPRDLSYNKGKKYITRGEYDVTELGLKEASLKIMPEGTVLLSSRAPIGYLAISRTKVTTNQGFKSFVPNKGFSSEYIYYTIQNLIPEIEAKSSGSTFKEVSTSTLRTINTILPANYILLEFSIIIEPIFKRQNCSELQNQELAQLRDWLLPMLMNGQVTVGDAEEMVNEQLDIVAEGGVEFKKN
jgi:type I restriction enzyme S subunit